MLVGTRNRLFVVKEILERALLNETEIISQHTIEEAAFIEKIREFTGQVDNLLKTGEKELDKN